MSPGATYHLVSEAECDKMHQLEADGVNINDIAVRTARSTRTVRRHLNGRCKHISPEHASTASKDELIDAIHELADELGRVPSLREWRAWSDKPHNSDTVIRKLGGDWREAIKQTDLPLVASGATKAIRTAAYQRPELCSNPAEVDS